MQTAELVHHPFVYQQLHPNPIFYIRYVAITEVLVEGAWYDGDVVQLMLFYCLLVVLQGGLVVLFNPLPTPDLFLLGALTLLWRLPAWQLVLIGYGVGLLQDTIGHGALGFHALGIAGGMLVAAGVSNRINQAGFVERLLLVVCALFGKWVVFAFMLLWQNHPGSVGTSVSQIAPLDALFTLVASVAVLPVGEWLIERNGKLKRELL